RRAAGGAAARSAAAALGLRRRPADRSRRRCAAFRGAVPRCTAHLARHAPGRPAGRQDHRGAAAVTAADTLTPAHFPDAPAGMAGLVPAGVRLTWLYLRTRRVPAGIVALAVCGAGLRAVLYWNSGSDTQQFPMIVEAGAAAVIA